jgi:hypothetical protein
MSLSKCGPNRAHYVGGKRPDIERTWRNARLDDETHKFSTSWAVPQKGFIELDFVQITKPTSAHNLSTDDEIESLLSRFHPQTDEDKLVTIRDYFNRKVVMCKQVQTMLMALNRDKDRVELLVAAFARVLDWHGYSSLLSLINNHELAMVAQRIGMVNLFDEVMAVGFYELDLSIPEQRWVVQEIVHLACVEPGDNLIEAQRDGVDFPFPATWAQDVSTRGVHTFYYCRTQEVIEKVMQCGSYDSRDYPYAVDGEIPEVHRTQYGVWFLQVCEKIDARVRLHSGRSKKDFLFDVCGE